jgi:hypothetical protein
MASAPVLDQRFAIAAGPWPAAEARIARLVRLSNHGDYEDAARAAEPLLAEGVHDVHVVVRFLFGAFLARGLVVLPDLFGGLAGTLEDAAGALGPAGYGAEPGSAGRSPIVDQRGEGWTQVDLAFTWLCRTLRDRIGFHHAQRDEVMRGWVAALGLESIEAIRAGIARLSAGIARSLPGSRSLEQLAALDGFAGGTLRGLLPRPAPARPVPAPEVAPPPAALALPLATMGEGPERAATEEPPRAPALEPPPASDLDSPALRLLRDKLAGFDALMERGDFARAAIVASDVQRIVEGFDPRLYLPRLFAGFYRRLAAGAGALAPHWEGEASLAARALSQLYQVDLHAFLEAD